LAEPKKAPAERPALRDRARFKTLLAQNVNYFGNLADVSIAPVKKVVGDTTFEALTCVGFNPRTNVLEATIEVKLPTGYGGDLCHPGSIEYVRFFIDYGSGWEDAGLAGVSVHDIRNGTDCAGAPEKPLIYVASLKIDPKTDCCTHPVLPRVRAILSWQWIPPAGAANAGWQPVWGNVDECHIQIQPHPWNIFCLWELFGEKVPDKVEFPKLFEEVKFEPIPLPDPPPFSLADLAGLYGAGQSAGRRKETAAPSVEPHRFGTTALHALAGPGGFSLEALAAQKAEWESVGLDFSSAIAAFEKTNANVSYEELECLGLDETTPERLVATFRVKLPTGYSGDLCEAGSFEYVAFWADWDDTCDWTYLGTAAVNVHDIANIPKDGLCYAAILPVDLTHHRRGCEKPKIARVRAVMSWQVPPSTTDPDKLEYWGNRLDAHVQLEPGDEIPPGEVLATIRNIGGIAVEQIATAGNGMTLPGAFFAHYPGTPADGWGLNRACPFGGTVNIEGLFFDGYYYRVKVHKSGELPTTYTVLADSFLLEHIVIGFTLQTSSGGWFKYKDPLQYFNRLLALWPTSQTGPWEVQLDIATAPNDASIVASSPWYHVELDNVGPSIPSTMDIHIASGGDCKDVDEGDPVAGTFVASDVHFGAWSLSTLPNTPSTPSNQPAPNPFLANTTPAPGGHGWELNTASPIVMEPCGYVVQLTVWDRSIVNSYPGSHNGDHVEVGFCLREKS
jgi:hypothetical protein